MTSPIGARRMKTDLLTSENIFIQTNNSLLNRSRSNSPINPRYHQLPTTSSTAAMNTSGVNLTTKIESR